jgi:hypothetical protein
MKKEKVYDYIGITIGATLTAMGLVMFLGTKSKEPTLFQMGDEFARF